MTRASSLFLAVSILGTSLIEEKLLHASAAITERNWERIIHSRNLGSSDSSSSSSAGCSADKDFGFVAAFSYNSIEEGDVVARDWIRAYNLFTGCDDLHRGLDSFEILETAISRNGVASQFEEKRQLQVGVSASDFVIGYSGQCNCGSQTTGFGGNSGSRLLKSGANTRNSSSSTTKSSRSKGRSTSSSSSSSERKCPCPAGVSQVTIEDVIAKMETKPYSVVEVVDRSQSDCEVDDSPAAKSNPSDFQECLFVDLSGSGDDGRLTQHEIQLASQAFLRGINTVSFETCTVFHFSATEATLEIVPDEERRRLSGRDRDLQSSSIFKYALSYTGGCPGCQSQTVRKGHTTWFDVSP